MIAKLKTWIATAGTLLLVILTLGGYAKYQSNKRRKAEMQRDDAQRQVALSEQIQQREFRQKKKNNDTKTNTINRIRTRRYFGLHNGRNDV